MSKNLKRHLISALTTFSSVFLVTFSFAISSNEFTFSQETLVAVALSALIAGVRGVAKLVIEWNTLSTS